jgi:DNA-binding HxlR family transcriptional regulator
VRSYGQYCALAKSLDVVGDRWTLLVVRELMLRGPSRYTDLREGLPGIATNLLADRLRVLERAGLLAREDAPPPIATTLFSLTSRGAELRPVLDALVNWGVPYIAEGPAPGEELRSHWLAWPAEQFLRDDEPDSPPATIEVRSDSGSVVIEVGGGELRARPGRAALADVVIEGDPHSAFRVLSGQLPLHVARAMGVHVHGDTRAIARVSRI